MSDRPRRVVLLVQNLPVPFDRRVWQEATSLRQAGYEVSVVCPSDTQYPVGVFEIDGVHIRRYKSVHEGNGPWGYVREYVWAAAMMSVALLKVVFRRGRPHVIHFCNPPDFLFAVALPYKVVTRSRLIFDQHDLGPELVRAKSLPMSKIFEVIALALERLSYVAADAVISTNGSYREAALTRGHFRPDRVAIVRSAPRADSFSRVSADPAYRRGREFLVGYIGVMGVQEGIQYLLRAARILVLERELDVQFALIGSGTARADLEELSRELGVADHVEFFGRVSDEILRSVICSADICANPDEVNELNDKSTMNKIVEYMALGRPIVQFEVTEGRFSAGESSLYARANDVTDFADCLERLLQDPQLRQEMGELGARRFADELTWERQVPHLLCLYDGLLGP